MTGRSESCEARAGFGLLPRREVSEEPGVSVVQCMGELTRLNRLFLLSWTTAAPQAPRKSAPSRSLHAEAWKAAEEV